MPGTEGQMISIRTIKTVYNSNTYENATMKLITLPSNFKDE